MTDGQREGVRDEGMSGPRRRRRLGVLVLGLLLPALGHGYEPQVHQRLTFYAAKLLNHCLEGSDLEPLTPLQVRFIARSNMGLANSNLMVRFFRWGYFDAVDGDDRKVLWVINTRFLDHFEEVAQKLGHGPGDSADQYRELGRIVSYVQLVSSPARAVPVYAARFWRWSFSDRFEGFEVRERTLEAALSDDCSFLSPPPVSYRQILFDVAKDTLQAVRSPIGGLPTTWESFWQPAKHSGDFGDYGAAGNSFGRRAEFPCNQDSGETCVLLDNDPLYLEFALARQIAAIRGTARAMYLHQQRDDEPRTAGQLAGER